VCGQLHDLSYVHAGRRMSTVRDPRHVSGRCGYVHLRIGQRHTTADADVRLMRHDEILTAVNNALNGCRVP